jgi:hypothetical protein
MVPLIGIYAPFTTPLSGACGDGFPSGSGRKHSSKEFGERVRTQAMNSNTVRRTQFDSSDRRTVQRALKHAEGLTAILRTLATPPEERRRDPISEYRHVMLCRVVEQHPEMHDEIFLETGKPNLCGLERLTGFSRTAIRGYMNGTKGDTTQVALRFERFWDEQGVESDIERLRKVHGLVHGTPHRSR